MALTETEQRVCRIVAGRKSGLEHDLRTFVGIPTGLNHAAGLDETRERLTRRLGALGAAVELVPGDPKPAWLHEPGSGGDGGIPPTAVCRRPAGDAAPFLIAGHLDTVHDPRSAFRSLVVAGDGKTATGPGCVDMKGGLVIAAHALEALDEAGVARGWTVLLNSDEETGSYHSARALEAEARSGRYAAGIALEPATAEGGLVVERAGSGQFHVGVRGRAAHVGRDFTAGVSAVTALARVIVGADGLCEPSAGRIVNIAPIRGGVAANVVAERAEAWGNVRFPSEQAGRELEAGLAAVAARQGGAAEIEVRVSLNRPAKPMTPGTERLAALARGAAEDLGQRLPFSKTGGVCDGNNMQAAGLATIDTLGVRGGGLHTPGEWIEMASLVERCQLLAVVLMRV